MNELWTKRTQSEKVLLLLCVVVIGVGLWIKAHPKTTANGYTLTSTEADAKRRQVEVKIRGLRNETDALKPNIDNLTYNDSPDAAVPKVIRTLQKCAKDSGIHIREVKPMRFKKVTDVTRVPLNVRFTCEFGKSIPFLYRVEDPANKVVVNKFTVTAADPKTHMVDVDVEVVLFTQGTVAGPEGTGG